MISELFWQCGIFPHDFWNVVTVWYFSTWYLNCSDSVVYFEMISKLFWQCSIFRNDFWTVLTVWYFSTWFLNCSDSVVFPTLFLNYSAIPAVVCFSTFFRNWSDSVVFFYMLFYKISELFWQCGIFLQDFGTVLTVWYFSTCVCTRPGKWTVMYLCVRSIGICLSSRIYCMISKLFWQCGIFYMTSERLWQCGIFLHVFLHDFGTVLTMWYFLHDIGTALRALYFSKCFSTWFQKCSDSVVFY